MKSKKVLAIVFTLVLAIGLLPMSVFAAQTVVAADSTASITVNNAVENDELAAYKVIDITYDANTNTLNYAWNSAFADYFAGTTSYNPTAYTVEQFDLLTDDSDGLKALLAQLPNYIAARTIAPVDTQTVGADKSATFADLTMGEYFIRPTSSTSVYQLMLQKVEPVVVDVAGTQTYVIDDVAFTAKHEEVTVDKSANKTSVTKNETVIYTITAEIPTYAVQSVDKSFYISDLLPDGLTIDTDSITIRIDGVDVPEANYTLDTTATAAYTFKLSVDTAKYAANWAAEGGKELVITYTATLNDDNTTEVNTVETNTVTFDYSFYPYENDSHEQKTDTADVTTFAIQIDKFVNGQPTQKLANAKFDLYRTATQAEIDAGLAVVIPHTAVQGIKLEADQVTDSNGSATFEKYEANGTNYNYYLVETQAPSGYNLLTEAITVNFTDADVEATAGIYTVQIPNNSGIVLPVTGGTGTVIFTVIGIALMLGAVVLFVVSRKKTNVSEGK